LFPLFSESWGLTGQKGSCCCSRYGGDITGAIDLMIGNRWVMVNWGLFWIVGADGEGTSEWGFVVDESGVEILIEVDIGADCETVGVARGIDEPSGLIWRETNEGSTASALHLLLGRDGSAMKVWGVFLVVDRTAKDAKISQGGFRAIGDKVGG